MGEWRKMNLGFMKMERKFIPYYNGKCEAKHLSEKPVTDFNSSYNFHSSEVLLIRYLNKMSLSVAYFQNIRSCVRH
jgi:hypothetical protein